MHKGSQVFSTLSPWDIRVLGFQDVRKGCAFSSLLAWARRVGCPEGGMRSWGCCSPPAAWMAVAMAVAKSGGTGWRRPGAAALLEGEALSGGDFNYLSLDGLSLHPTFTST